MPLTDLVGDADDPCLECGHQWDNHSRIGECRQCSTCPGLTL